ncbi:hypothetical protein CVIRNUC_002460 [Coccomyxa viridis]|uniref:Uncharacterized protein n=1 Tax=Coccomyxa viridis TaxID=1274662 RepID=A0AAV1HWJ7_9CHLO|nr:hypothetical protein CVIRNUC_002460 [Coccomyxa viridis]
MPEACTSSQAQQAREEMCMPQGRLGTFTGPRRARFTVSKGYVPPEKHELKKRHRQLGQLICRRCQELSNGSMVQGVADLWGRDAAGQDDRLVSPEQLRTQLARVREKRAVAVLLVDLMDASGSFLPRVRELVGRNPVVLVGTKADLLPAGSNEAAVAAWLQRTAFHKKLNPIATFLVSSRTGLGVAEVVKAVRIERMGRDVYIMGAANVGKSAFVRAFVKEMSSFSSSQFDAAAVSTGRHLPVESAMPGTTLQIIPLEAFQSGGTLYDTPGVHLQHSLQHLLPPEQFKELLPKGRLKPFYPPTPQDLALQQQRTSRSHSRATGAAGTYLWGGLCRIDVLDAPLTAALAFYSPKALRVHAMPLADSHARPEMSAERSPRYKSPQIAASEPHPSLGDADSSEALKESGSSRSAAEDMSSIGPGHDREHLSTGPTYAGFVRDRGGLCVAKEATLSIRAPGRVADISVSGLPGWVSVETEQSQGRLVLRVWAPRGIGAYVRPPLPIGHGRKPAAARQPIQSILPQT